MSTQVIAGRYELGERLGYGGMSTVQLALDRRLERHVAVKLLAEHLADDSQFVSRFRREALSAARLVHPNIVQVFDFGLDDPSGRHYIVMEYIRGKSGAEILRDQSRLGIDEALELVDGACRGLQHAHRMGVVHRDVKPGNILRSDDGQIKLADFGIAKATLDGAGSAITQVGSVLGTAAYLAPEQATGEEAGPQADIYGLGVVTYQFLAGRLPYDAASLTELALKQQREVPPRLDQVDPEIPAALGVAVEKALALDPGQRYGSAEEMGHALRDGARGIAPEGVDATAATAFLQAGGDPTDATRAVPAAGARRLEPQRPSRPMPAATPYYDDEIDDRRARRRDAERRRGRGRRWLILTLIFLLVIAALVIVLSAGSGSDTLRIDEVTGDSVGEIVDNARQLIDDNTR